MVQRSGIIPWRGGQTGDAKPVIQINPGLVLSRQRGDSWMGNPETHFSNNLGVKQHLAGVAEGAVSRARISTKMVVAGTNLNSDHTQKP
jgi:hypothetical protein